jgi:hypothetical protein
MISFKFDVAFLSHTNNIAQKCRIAKTPELKALCSQVSDAWAGFLKALAASHIESGDMGPATEALNTYIEFAKAIEKASTFFNWRSDFAASIIPEFVYRCLHFLLSRRGVVPLFATRDSVVEITLAGSAKGGWLVRHKNQDLSVGLRREKIVGELGGLEFLVPIVAMEVKTNIDINKLNGLDFSAERLKRTFPGARYLLVTETIDFSLDDNYASTAIDEVYVLRKQMRSLNRKHRTPLCADVFETLFRDVCDLIERAGKARGHVYESLKGGRLIHAN